MERPGINRRQLRRTISRQFAGRLKKKTISKITRDVHRAKELMLAEFDSHPVTREIKAGPEANNMSGTLGGTGNLFSFIGFDRGDRPIAPVRHILESSTKLLSVRKVGRGDVAFDVIIQLPDKDEIAKKSPLPWAAARSWVKGIEQGLPGLGKFLVKPGMGRSGNAIQVGGTVRSGRFRNTKYVSAILAELHSNLRQFLKI